MTLQKHLILVQLVGLLWLTPSALPANNELPELSVQQGIDHTQEAQLGADFFARLDQAGLLEHDPVLLRFLNDIGDKLVTQLPRIEYRYRFYLVKNDQINAFALPGGHIGIHSGLILAAETEDELAAVVAHEIAHIYQQHSLQMRAEASRSGRTTLALMLAALLLGKDNIDIAGASMVAASAGQQQGWINFTRENEYEADRIGIGLLNQADYNPLAMAEIFNKLGKQQGGEGIEYLQTHPVSSNRIAEARNRVNHTNTISQPAKTHDFGLAQAYLRKALGLPQPAASSGPFIEAMQALEKGQHAQALNILQALHQQQPGNLWIGASLLQAAESSAQTALMIETLNRLLLHHPHDRHLSKQLAQSYLSSGALQSAEQLLLQLRIEEASDPSIYPLLQTLYLNQAKPLRALEAEADYLRLKQERHSALRLYQSLLPKLDQHPGQQQKIAQRIEQLQTAIEADLVASKKTGNK